MLRPLIFGAAAALYLAMSLKKLLHLRWVGRLPALDALVPGGALQLLHKKPATCSVVIAARDEQMRVEQTVRHLLAQVGVELEIIVVDDRSADGTSEILNRLAKDDARLQVKRVDALPEGWLGKCHACRVG